MGLVIGSREGFSATLFYSTVYAFTLVGAFYVAALVRRETGGDKRKRVKRAVNRVAEPRLPMTSPIKL